MRSLLAWAVAIGVTAAGTALAQNVSLPSNDWNSSWGFPSTGQKQVRILQSDLIEKKEAGYYESLGTNNYSVSNSVTYDYSQGRMEVMAADGSAVDVTNRTGEDIGQNTNVIGSINQSETTIDISGDYSTARAVNEATARGCQDGSISIDSANTQPSASNCN